MERGELFVKRLKELKISNRQATDPELFSLHQNIAVLLFKNSRDQSMRTNDHVERMICDDLIDPIL